MTLGDYIRSHSVNAEGIETLIRCWTQPGFGADPDQLSLLFVIHYIACSGNETQQGHLRAQLRHQERRAGAAVRRWLAADPAAAGEPARFAGRAERRRDEDRPEQLPRPSYARRAGTVTCKRVIVAAPPELARAIQWGPALPARHQALLDRMNMGDLMKCDAVY